MTTLYSISSHVARSPKPAGLLFLALILAACLTTLSMVIDAVEQYRARDASLDTLSRLEFASRRGVNKARPPGSPFFKGQTSTLASAALLQRITSIISKAGGTVVSTEVVQQGAQSKDGYLTAIANCELEQDALQRVLYDIEAGVPFLFVDQLIIQTASGTSENGPLRVTLGIAAQWAGVE
jgi:general secretion pathway protein M